MGGYCPNSVCGLLAGGAIDVLMGNGDGTFQTAQIYDSGGGIGGPWGGQGPSIALADANKDGKLDVLVANPGPTTEGFRGAVGVLLGKGDGTFQAAQTFDSGGFGASSITVADVNGDGKLDTLVANWLASDRSPGCGDGDVGVLLGNGDGTFQAAQIYDSGGYGASSIIVGDANREGRLDVFVANQSIPGVRKGILGVLLGNGDGTFQTVQTYASGGNFANSIAVADVDRDGKPDLLVANGGNNFGGIKPPQMHGSVGVLLGTAKYATGSIVTSELESLDLRPSHHVYSDREIDRPTPGDGVGKS